MKIAILDDYQDVVRTLPSFSKVSGQDVQIWHDHPRDLDVLAERLQDREALVLTRERTAITDELLQRLPKLRIVSQFGAVPNIDVEACTRRGVMVCSQTSTGQPSYSTAELTWGLIIATLRRIPQEVAALKAGVWQSPGSAGITLRGRMLGIYGYGRIGSVVAQYGRAFGMKVLVWGREAALQRARADGFKAAESESRFFEQPDVLSLHLALNEATRGIVTRALLDKMKPGSLIVNTSRAELIEPGALLAALQAGRPAFGAVDVFEDEPIVGAAHPLLALPNVVATPHLGYVAVERLDTMFDTAFEQVLRFEQGTPINVVNPPPRAVGETTIGSISRAGIPGSL